MPMASFDATAAIGAARPAGAASCITGAVSANIACAASGRADTIRTRAYFTTVTTFDAGC
jgi:hypothetical protein